MRRRRGRVQRTDNRRMSPEPLPFLDAPALARLAQATATTTPCPRCAGLVCPGWESLPGGFDAKRLQPLATLRRADNEEPTLQEYHPDGTDHWSAAAPIAPAFFPYNRCEVWACTGCARPFLRYTEYGGYYQEQRLRELRANLVSGVGGTGSPAP